jgi:ParB-like chromosome segregation protein Spo0J
MDGASARLIPVSGRFHAEAGVRERIADPPVLLPVAVLADADSPRVNGADEEHVRLLAASPTDLPPIVVHRSTMQVVDGVHRLRAARLAGAEHIAARYFDGSAEEAFVYAVEANAEHGLPLSAADRTAAAGRILRSYPEWSDRAVAGIAGLSDKTVAAIRRRTTADFPNLNHRVGTDGRRRPVDFAVGRLHAGRLLAQDPDRPLKEVAGEAGVAVGTARDVRRRLSRGESPLPPAQQPGRPRPDARRRPEPKQPEPETAEIAPHEAIREVLDELARDPALRYSEAGLSLLRLLVAHRGGPDVWQRFAESVPPHCADAVAAVSRRCAQVWLDFAGRVGGSCSQDRTAGRRRLERNAGKP